MKKIKVEIGIYKLYWNNCDYFYYGQSRNLNKRVVEHNNKLEKNKHVNKMVQRIFNKYGRPLFEIIEYCTLDDLNNVEQKYLDKYISNENCCNINPKAESCKGRVVSKETRDKMSKWRTGKPSYVRTAENRAATSERGKLYRTSNETKELLRNINLGKKYSDETNKKKGTKRYGKDNPWSRKVNQLDFYGNIVNVYDSIKIAASQNGISTDTVSDTCKGKKNKKNLYFEYANTIIQ